MKVTELASGASFFFLAACGAGTGSFVGSWNVTTDVWTVSCAPSSTTTYSILGDAGETVTFTAEPDGTLSEASSNLVGGGSFEVSGDVATGTGGGATLSTAASDGPAVAFSFTSDTFTTRDGKNATESISAVSAPTADGSQLACSASGSRVLTKQP